MSEMKPTPGEWLAEIYENGGFDVFVKGQGHDGGDITLCSRMPYTSRASEMHSNARLIAEAGTVFHNTGLSPVQLVEMVKELKAALRKYEDVREDMFTFFLSNGIFNQWGKRYDCSALNNAHLQASAALAKCEGVK